MMASKQYIELALGLDFGFECCGFGLILSYSVV